MKKIVCFYFNYGKKCGYGHLSRCSVLNNLLKKSGINSHFLKIKNLDISYLKNFKLIAIKDLKKIKIDPEVLSDAEGLEDLIIGAFEDAASKIEDDGGGMPGLPSGLGGLSNLLG